jgi:hypothetical protein
MKLDNIICTLLFNVFSQYIEEVLHAFILVCHVIEPIDTCPFKQWPTCNFISNFLTLDASSLNEISVVIN